MSCFVLSFSDELSPVRSNMATDSSIAQAQLPEQNDSDSDAPAAEQSASVPDAPAAEHSNSASGVLA